MRILFLNGPSQDSCDRFFGWPTSLLYAMAPAVQAVKKGELEAEICPAIFDPIWYRNGANDIDIMLKFKKAIDGIDVICASTTYDAVHPTLELLREAKCHNRFILNILGGPHVDEVLSLPQFAEFTQGNSPVDIAIAGDGEYVLLKILENISKHQQPLQDIEGVTGKALVWQKGQDILAKTNQSNIDLNALPLLPIEYAEMDRHKHDFDVFRNDTGKVLPTVQLIAHRGCSYACSFCSEGRFLTKPNSRTVANLIAEIDVRKSQGFNAVFFDDSTFGAYRHLRELLAELPNFGLQFGCLNRFNHLADPLIVEKYKEAGFKYFYCAIEQFDNRVLRRMNKNISTDKIKLAMGNLRNYGFILGVSLLYGVPYEREDSVKATLDFVAEWVDAGVIRLVSESVLSLHPGTVEGSSLVSGFDRIPPNLGYPFTRFEEGQWYHLPMVNAAYLERIAALSEQRFGKVLIRNRHSWYQKNGLVSHVHKDQPAEQSSKLNTRMS